MGIRSFTKYLEDRSDQFFEKYELRDCSLVIDGHNIGNKLYNWKYSELKAGYSPYCYGGDYDKYADIVKSFLGLLLKCNVTPYIVFDGCNEDDKASLIKERLNDQVKSNSAMTPTVRNQTYAVGAVALRYAFRDAVVELKLKAFTCTSKANRKMASLAKYLKCPVLSADSDFFISGDMLIPFSSMDCKIGENKSISCKIYRIESLMNALNKRRDVHYLVPVLLGNKDSSDMFSSFFKKVGIRGSRQNMIEGIFRWLKRQHTVETAVKEILNSSANKVRIFKEINNTITRYVPLSIKSMLEFLDIDPNHQNELTCINFENLEKQLGLTKEEADIEDIQATELFGKKVMNCQYPAFFIDMLKADRYFVWPHIEDCSKPDANSIGYNIMSAIHNILVQTDGRRLTVLRRNTKNQLEEYDIPAFKDQLPSIEEIEYLRSEKRQDLILEILEIDQNFSQIFGSFPKEWHLLLLSLKYAGSKSQFEAPFIHSVIVGFIVLNYIDSRLNGFYRSAADSTNIHEIPQTAQNNDFGVGENEFPKISEGESVVFLPKIIEYFEFSVEDERTEYDRGIMHSMAELQCVFLHLKYLNNLLEFPFEDVFIYKVFDGTFIYKMTKHLRSNASLKKYYPMLLQDCPSIHRQLDYVLESLERHSIL